METELYPRLSGRDRQSGSDDKLEKYTKRILNKKPVALSPIAFNIDEANAEIDIAEKELSEGKGIKEMENLPLQTGQSSIALW